MIWTNVYFYSNGVQEEMSQKKCKGVSSSSHIMHFYVLSYVTVFTMIELHCVTQGIGLLLKLNPKIEHQPFNQHFRLEPAETNFSEILIEIHNFNKKKRNWKCCYENGVILSRPKYVNRKVEFM